MDGPDYRTAAEYFRDKAHAEKTERMGGGMSTHAGARPPTPVGWSDTDWLSHLKVMPPIGYAVQDTLYGTSKAGVLRFCGSDEVGAFAVYIAPQQRWQPMKTAPKDGTAVLVLLCGSDISHAARWLSGPDDPHATGQTERAGWHLTWDGWPVPEHDGPRYWMYCPDDPDPVSGS